MKLLLLAAVFVLASCNVPDYEWNNYKAKYNKNYNGDDDRIRRQAYVRNKNIIEEHNKKYKEGHATYNMEVNIYTDWYTEELNDLLGVPPNVNNDKGKPYKEIVGVTPPPYINWVDKGAVTSVKNQIKCGNSYAFSAVGAMEGLVFVTNHSTTDLSAQELVDCSGNSGCDGGYPQLAFEYIIKRPGIDTDASYPQKVELQREKQTCRANDGKIGGYCSGYYNIKDEKGLWNAVGLQQPVSVLFSVDIASFMSYKSGVFNGKCGDRQNHAMLAVGYGKDEHTGKEFWILKNSFSQDWGENGYIRVVRNENKCKLAEKASFPFLEIVKGA